MRHEPICVIASTALAVGLLVLLPAVATSQPERPAPSQAKGQPEGRAEGRGPIDGAAPSAAALTEAIGQLGDLDYTIRMKASSVVRRAPATDAVAALTEAAARHEDGYVRFRALVLLAGFNDPESRSLMEAALTDENDRLREVAYRYFEEHPGPGLVPQLLAAVPKETSEFVRPPLMRALAAHGSDPKVQATLKREAMSGQDYFRSSVIEVLGDHGATYALPELLEVAQRDGPLQKDAVLALGRIGDRRAMDVLARLQRSASPELQPTLASAICLLGVNCESHQRFLEETLRFASSEVGFQPLLRATADAVAELGIAGDSGALSLLFDTAAPARDPIRAPLVLGVGTIVLRNPPLLLDYLAEESLGAGRLDVLREAFDMLQEDYAQERFFATVRGTFWSAAEGSPERKMAQTLIRALEF